MVLSVDDNKRLVATIQSRSQIETYECHISACENPACTCRNVDLELIPMQSGDHTEGLQHRIVKIDLDTQALGHKKRVPKEELEFANSFLSELDQNDFQILHENHYKFKNKISERAAPEDIDGYFDYHEVEYEGLMSAYNDVLPFGDQFMVTINGEQYVVLDQYCLLPKCSCTDTILNIISIDHLGKMGEELGTIALNYKKRQWQLKEDLSFPLTLETLKTTIEEQIPDFYRQMLQRHKKLKAIYAHNKKMHYASKLEPQVSKVGRNDPCPCGSGKKYKKCCLN